ncbi:predicted protein [Sclerotinia sclerotiorum 1980 UF-70]|uniref:Uncharacterized protein n=1 Tax=Sclerotinia sclerotiorum (strain ATCC 18683 / 1980 / Ss-1) TaxID=665079 RepID=A7EU99_SCLS1|nr:predicted protein [Sclerotinia sclerotiorum 1980 UF-70]EDN93041.1 predicted protein [Sclerotinia sclerotiorum 1980 UF-70]
MDRQPETNTKRNIGFLKNLLDENHCILGPLAEKLTSSGALPKYNEDDVSGR